MKKIGLLSTNIYKEGRGFYSVDFNNGGLTKEYDMIDYSQKEEGNSSYLIDASANSTSNYIIIGDEVCGYQRVKFESGEYGFLRVIDNKLMPYRFEVADDFNKYGLALVARDGVINYIDTNFQVFEYDIKYDQPLGHYLLDYWISYGKEMFDEDFKRELFPLRKKVIEEEMTGFDKMSCFFEGEKPFAIIGEHFTERSFPINPDGELVTFRNYYDHEKENSIIPFNGGRLLVIDSGAIMFEDNTYNNPRVYFSNGIYMTLRDIIKFSNDLGLCSIIDDYCEEKYGNKDSLDQTYKESIGYFRNNGINYKILGTNEVVSIVEWVTRMVSLKEFQDCLSRLPNGYEKEGVNYTKRLIHPR